jgi:hypothetical protein
MVLNISCNFVSKEDRLIHPKIPNPIPATNDLRFMLTGHLLDRSSKCLSDADVRRERTFHQGRLGEAYEAAHTKLAVDYIGTIKNRRKLLKQGELKTLSEASQAAADKSYIDAAKLSTGFEKVLKSYAQSIEPNKKRIYQIWRCSTKIKGP